MSPPSSNPSASNRAETAAANDRYAVVCRCGWTSRGDREETALEIECDGCGARQFVLPKNVYPLAGNQPIAPSRKRRDKPPSNEAGAKSRSRSAIKPPPRAQPAPDTAGEPATTSTKIKVPTNRKRRRFTSPLVMSIVGGVVILTATVLWTLHRRAILAAEHQFKTHADAGIAFVREREFGQAVDELRLAVAALDELDRDDARARQVRQMLREAQAIDELSPRSLYGMLNEFENERQQGNAKWTSHFDSQYANRWIVLVTTAWRDPAGDGRVVLDFPLAVGGAPVRLSGEPAILDKMTLSDKPRQVVIAAQLHSCHRVTDPESEWQVRLDPDSAFLWTDYDNFRALGFGVAEGSEIDTEAAVRRLLDEQAEIMEVKE